MRRAWPAVFGLMLACAWGSNQFTPLMVLYRRDEHYSAVAVNLFLGISLLGLTPTLLAAGGWSQRCGRRPLMVAGGLCAAAGSASLACSSGPLAICLGRLLAGVGAGAALAVGTTWLKELSQPPHDRGADSGAGARRASVAFTAGSASGALVAGALAQWTPWGARLPLAAHLALTLPLVWLVARAPETVAGAGARRAAFAPHGSWTPSAPAGMRPPRSRRPPLPPATRRSLARVVLPSAFWLFAGTAVVYAYLPLLLAGAAGSVALAYAALLAAATHGTGALVQPLIRRRLPRAAAHGPAAALAIVAAGFVLVAAAVRAQSLALGVAAAVVMGAGLGVGLVSCLLELQRVAPPQRLAGLTGLFYAVAYGGFLLPAAMAALVPVLPTGTQLLLLAALALAGSESVRRRR